MCITHLPCILCCLKVHFMPLSFYDRPTLVPAFTKWMTSEEDFCNYKKEAKRENSRMCLEVIASLCCFGV